MTKRMTTQKVASPPRSTVDAAGWLGLAAAPTFSLMAAMSAVSSPGMTMCAADSVFAPVNDMALMYVLMGLFHLTPWIRLIVAHSPRLTTPVNQTEGD